jgi:hypothetical protein
MRRLQQEPGVVEGQNQTQQVVRAFFQVAQLASYGYGMGGAHVRVSKFPLLSHVCHVPSVFNTRLALQI